MLMTLGVPWTCGWVGSCCVTDRMPVRPTCVFVTTGGGVTCVPGWPVVGGGVPGGLAAPGTAEGACGGCNSCEPAPNSRRH